ncbi:E3 ubiquitin-protein ligase upl6-like protein, partial [Trifolium pratense]
RYEGDISELELYFVILNNEYGEQTEEDLLPGGKNLRVTNENVITFIHLVANHRLNSQIRQQSSHFLRGFQQLIQKDWIDMFNEHELQLLISGSLDSLDVDDLRQHTNYAGTYHSVSVIPHVFVHDSDVQSWTSLSYTKECLNLHQGVSKPTPLITNSEFVTVMWQWLIRQMLNKKHSQLTNSACTASFELANLSYLSRNSLWLLQHPLEHNVIEMFWEVLKGFSMENQKKFLKFVTGCSRGPLLGFRYLEPLFCIQRQRDCWVQYSDFVPCRAGGNASEDALDRLPTSATCMNLLKLPPYRRRGRSKFYDECITCIRHDKE